MKKILLLLSVLALLYSCETGKNVEYIVSSNKNGFDITYENSNGGTSQETITDKYWNYTFKGETGDFVYISAQADNESQSISATIKIDGKVFQTSDSNGDYVIATASGSIQ